MSAATAELTEIVRTAVRAPSMHNTQPWRFRITPGAEAGIEGALIEVRGDLSRGLPVADPTGWALRVACGAAAGLDSSMLSQPIEAPDLRSQLRAQLGRTGGWPQMVLRFGYGVRTPATPRRPVSEVLEIAPVAHYQQRGAARGAQQAACRVPAVHGAFDRHYREPVVEWLDLDRQPRLG